MFYFAPSCVNQASAARVFGKSGVDDGSMSAQWGNASASVNKAVATTSARIATEVGTTTPLDGPNWKLARVVALASVTPCISAGKARSAEAARTSHRQQLYVSSAHAKASRPYRYEA